MKLEGIGGQSGGQLVCPFLYKIFHIKQKDPYKKMMVYMWSYQKASYLLLDNEIYCNCCLFSICHSLPSTILVKLVFIQINK